MSEQKYIAITNPNEGGWIIGKHQTHWRYVETNIAEVIDILNTPTPPAAGIVWRKPGEPGRVAGKRYLCLWTDLDCTVSSWRGGSMNDGWDSTQIIAWADLPSPPAWANGGAA